MTKQLSKDTIAVLKNFAKKAQIEEGFETIRYVFREIFRNQPIGTKGLAKRVCMPIPVVAALRKELEKAGYLGRTHKGAELTEKGQIFVKNELKLSYKETLICKRCNGMGFELPPESSKLFPKQNAFAKKRPHPLTTIDQAYGKPITAMRRAYYLLENADVENRSILLLGDDDFTSTAISLLQLDASIVVVDIDERLLQLLDEIAEDNGFPIKCYQVDLREELPEHLVEQFDVVLTDPPYTLEGLQLFLSRAIQGLKKEPGKRLYLSFAHRPSNELLEIQKIINHAGLAIKEIIPKFNLYEGAEMHANTTFMMQLETTKKTKPLISKSFTKNIYTGEQTPTKREYKCSNGHVILVGKSCSIKTIEELKEKGCPICGQKEKFVLISREKIQ
ncbi:MAG: bis-aminopropyl spermidine synthase family protein [Asgard group archaeon]|nr:bis-aminopropyl spermidine synthase family protein [Asgard group archaeon]